MVFIDFMVVEGTSSHAIVEDESIEENNGVLDLGCYQEDLNIGGNMNTVSITPNYPNIEDKGNDFDQKDLDSALYANMQIWNPPFQMIIS